jgi:hypothetical protein
LVLVVRAALRVLAQEVLRVITVWLGQIHNLRQLLRQAVGLVQVLKQIMVATAVLVVDVQVIHQRVQTKAAQETRHLEAHHKEIKVGILGRFLATMVVLAAVEQLRLVEMERPLLVVTVVQDLLALLAGQVWPTVAVVAQALTVEGRQGRAALA